VKSVLITAVGGAVLIAGMPAASAQSTCEDLGGTVGVERVCHVQTGTAAYSIDIRFPLDYPDQQAVADYLKRNRADFLD
jgi:hypothetical protein